MAEEEAALLNAKNLPSAVWKREGEAATLDVVWRVRAAVTAGAEDTRPALETKPLLEMRPALDTRPALETKPALERNPLLETRPEPRVRVTVTGVWWVTTGKKEIERLKKANFDNGSK